MAKKRFERKKPSDRRASVRANGKQFGLTNAPNQLIKRAGHLPRQELRQAGDAPMQRRKAQPDSIEPDAFDELDQESEFSLPDRTRETPAGRTSFRPAGRSMRGTEREPSAKSKRRRKAESTRFAPDDITADESSPERSFKPPRDQHQLMRRVDRNSIDQDHDSIDDGRSTSTDRSTRRLSMDHTRRGDSASTSSSTNNGKQAARRAMRESREDDSPLISSDESEPADALPIRPVGRLSMDRSRRSDSAPAPNSKKKRRRSSRDAMQDAREDDIPIHQSDERLSPNDLPTRPSSRLSMERSRSMDRDSVQDRDRSGTQSTRSKKRRLRPDGQSDRLEDEQSFRFSDDAPLHDADGLPIDPTDVTTPRSAKKRRQKSQAAKHAKFQFSDDESVPSTKSSSNQSPRTSADGQTPQEKKQSKLQHKADVAAARLEKAQTNLPANHKAKKKAAQKFRFEEQAEDAAEIADFIKDAPVLSPSLQEAKRQADLGFRKMAASGVHDKLSEYDDENVGIESVHKLEQFAEGAYRGGKKVTRGAFKHAREKPYRDVKRAASKSVKAQERLLHSNLIAENPRLQSTFRTRLAQKRKIQRAHAAASYQSIEATVVQQHMRAFTARASKAAASFIRKHPMLAGSMALFILFAGIGASFLTVFSDAGNGSVATLIGSTYLASDEDITTAELLYTKWEVELLDKLQKVETYTPGYDEYNYRAGDVGHNPFEMMAFLTCAYRDFKVSEIEGILRGIFDAQYQYTTMEQTEIRYREEPVETIDPVTGEVVITYQQVPYTYRILHATLTTRSFTDVVAGRVGYEQSELYTVYMISKGNRQYMDSPFGDMNWLPYVSSYYGYRLDPFTSEPGMHTGLDIGMPSGTNILAGHDGVIIEAGDHGNYGNLVVIEGKDGLVSKYAHCDRMTVSSGQRVNTGDVIATVGSTGRSTGPHLHLEIYKNGFQLNPIYFANTNDHSAGSIGSGSGLTIPLDPGNMMGDDDFMRLIAEGNKHLGKAYVFGASGPRNFDCSGFVCWTFTKSGVRNLPRTNAQGIFNKCTPIAPDKAKPGDIIFFSGTYSTSNIVTHVGIYCGDNKMLHCGDPVQYAYITTNYWKKHFYAFGRLK